MSRLSNTLPVLVSDNPALITLGAHLKAIRKSRKLTRPMIRERTGISESTIIRIERGEKVSMEYLLGYAANLGEDVPVDAMRAYAPSAAAPVAMADAPSAPPEWFKAFAEQQAAFQQAVLAHLDTLTHPTRGKR